MIATANELEDIIQRHLVALEQIPETEYQLKPAPNKWSKKEIMGHLIDSAQANIRRMVLAQYEDNPRVTYQQDNWVRIVAYQEWDTREIILLWVGLNKQMCQILRHVPVSMYGRTSQTDASHTIEWLAADYVKHLKHHLHVVLGLEPVAYP